MSEHINGVSRRAFVAGVGALALGTGLLANPLRAHAEPASAQKQAEAQAALDSLHDLQSQFESAENAFSQATIEQQDAKAKMDEAQGRIDEASARISSLQEQLGERARTMYRNGSFSFLDLLLGATTFQAFTTNWDLLNDMNRDDASKVSETKDLKAEVQEQKATYEEQERIAREKAQAAEAATREAEAAMAEQQQVYDSLSAEAAALVKQEQEAAAAAEAANAVSVVEQASQAAAASGGGNAAASGGGSSSGGGASSGGSSSGGGGSSSSSSGGGSSAPAYNSGVGGSAVSRAYGAVGAPYVWGGVGPDGYDCSGLVGYCLTGQHARVVTSETCAAWPRVSNPQPGDVAARSGHVGIYIGGGMMIHAPYPGASVCVAPVGSGMYIVRPPW